MAEETEQNGLKSPVITTNEKLNSSGDKSSTKSIHKSNFDDKRSFSEELNQHKNGIIWAFNYGEEVAKRTEENIHAYQRKFLAKYFMLADNSPSDNEFNNTYIEMSRQPSTSKQIIDQKTPHSEKRLDTGRKRNRGNDSADHTWNTQRSRETPLPTFLWANSTEVWQTMVYKEEATSRTRNCRLFEDPFSFLPRMRAILVDWVMEVCEVYHLRRITYYLAVDYIDRFLTIKPAVPKHQLQLIGISALFVAAKLEEIYPPKLTEFSYVCDGACSNEDILECEILLLNTLGWDVNPMTPTGWLNLYMQIYFDKAKTETKKCEEGSVPFSRDFLYPQYSAFQFVLASHLVDLFSLDPGFLLFNYSIIAAGAMYFLFGRRVALRVSGLVWDDIKDCTEYMAVFYTIIRDAHDPKLQTVLFNEPDDRQDATYNSLRISIPCLTTDEHHSMQTHVIDLKYFEKATLLRLQRMGLKVRKTFVRKIKVQSTNENDSNEEEVFIEVDDNYGDDEEPPLVMFEIEKMSSPTAKDDKKMYCISNVGDTETDFFVSKNKYTFDEILIGINDYTNKTLLPRRLGNDLQIIVKD